MSIQVKNIEKHFGAFHALKIFHSIFLKVNWLPCLALQVVVKRLYSGLLPVLNRQTADRFC